MSSPRPASVARAVLGLALEAGTLVWRGKLCPPGASHDAGKTWPPWREIYGEDQPEELATLARPGVTISFYPGGRMIIERAGHPVELRKLPGDFAVGPTMLERATELGGAAISKALRDLVGLGDD